MSKTLAQPRRVKRLPVADVSALDARPVEFQKLSADRVKSLNLLHQGGRSISFDLGGRAIEARATWPFPRIEGRAARLHLVYGSHQFSIRVPWSLCEALLHDFAPEAELASLALQDRALLLEAALDAEISAVEKTLAVELQFRELTAADDPADAVFALSLKDEGAVWPCLIENLDPASLETFARQFASGARTGLPGVDVALPIRICQNAATLSLSELRSLQPGDVVMLEESDSRFILICDRLIAPFSARGPLIEILSKPTSIANSRWDWIMNDAPAPGSNPEQGSLEDIPVTVVFELGRKTMTVSEIKQMAAGSIVQLTEPARETVSLVANGKRLGEGEIVKIGEGLGVRILSTGANA